MQSKARQAKNQETSKNERWNK